MSVTPAQVLEQLKRIKGPDMEGNIVALGLVSEVLVKEGRVYFSITVPAPRAEELEPLRQAAEKVVKDIAGIKGVTAVLTAEAGAACAGERRPDAGKPPCAGRPRPCRHRRRRARTHARS